MEPGAARGPRSHRQNCWYQKRSSSSTIAHALHTYDAIQCISAYARQSSTWAPVAYSCKTQQVLVRLQILQHERHDCESRCLLPHRRQSVMLLLVIRLGLFLVELVVVIAIAVIVLLSSSLA